jgi:hypothetical protein
MKVVKLYRKADKPEFLQYVRSNGKAICVAYPIEKDNRWREAKWLNLNEVYIDWIREFA